MQYSLNELAESLAERANRQFDIPFREEIKLWIGLWRSRLIRDSLEKRPEDRKYFLTSISVNMNVVPDFPNCGVVVKSACKLPQPLRANGTLFDYVGSMDMMTSYPVVSSASLKYLNESKYTGSNPKVVWLDSYLYVFNAPNLKEVMVQSIFDNLSELNGKCFKVAGTDTTGCTSDDIPYPVSLDIQQRIVQAILSTELRTLIPQNDTEINLEEENNEK